MNNKKIKILYIHHAKGWGGAIISLINMIKNLDDNRFEVRVLLLKDSIVSKKLEENNIQYNIVGSKFYKYYYQYLVHSEAGHTKWFQLYKFFKQITSWVLSHFYFAPKELKKFNPDIIHLNSSVLTDWLKPSKKKAKVVIHIREPFKKGKFDLLSRFLIRQMKKYADHIIAISKDNCKRINLHEKTSTIYNIIRNNEDLNYGKISYSKKILYLGGVQEIKGFYLLVDALEYIDKDILIFFAGNIEHASKNIFKKFFPNNLKKIKYLNKLNNIDNVIKLGMIYNVEYYLKEVCCLISPFTKPHFPRPVIEAYLTKKPVIVTNVEGMDEIVFHMKTGLLVPVDNPQKLAEAINFLANNPLLAKELGENGYQFAVKHFSNENIKKIEDIYEKLISK